MEDAKEVYGYAQTLMRELGLDEGTNGHTLTFSQCQNFCKFSAFIGVQKNGNRKEWDAVKEIEVCFGDFEPLETAIG